MAEKFISDRNIHDGHRSRMKAKFLSHGSDIFDTYELLEMLLYNVIPYKDTNPISKRLLHAFGSLDGVLSADKEELMSVDGIGERAADYITRAGLAAMLLEIEPIIGDSLFSNFHESADFFKRYFEGAAEYKTVMLLLDNNLVPISLIKIANKDCANSALKTHTFITEAIRENASAVIIAHCHPFSSALPSEGDIAFTYTANSAFKQVGISLLEHFIISGKDFFGIMEKFKINICASNEKIKNFSYSRDAICHTQPSFKDLGFVSNAVVSESSYEVELAENILSPILAEASKDAALKLYLNYFSFERALSGTYENLSQNFGERCAFFMKLLAAVTSRRTTDSFTFGKFHPEGDIVSYFKALFIGEPVEKLYVMSFDKNRRPTACDLVGVGTVNETNILPRKVLEAAIKRKAASIALAHNHPRGNTSPSNEDLTFTDKIAGLTREAKIETDEHYVIAGSRCKISRKSTDC